MQRYNSKEQQRILIRYLLTYSILFTLGPAGLTAIFEEEKLLFIIYLSHPVFCGMS